ncbi:hypothetical protein BGZ83_008888 [Gryganskiella cystojenkinii]|nr:hypothetical protein BGZ83_008888 [Gryganskiella cystojenkinii]
MSHPGYTFGDPNHHQPQHHHRQDQYHAAQIPHGHAPHRQSLQQAHAAESDVTEIKDASDFPTLTTQFFTGYMEQPWNQTSHVVKGSGDAGISEEGTKSFTSESRTSAGESVSSSHGTPSSFSSSDKVLDHNAQATRSFDTVTVPLQEHPLSIPTALLRGTCAPAATAAASLEPIMTYSEAARRGNIDTNNGAGLRAAVFASKNELKGGGPSSASLPPFSSGRANPTTQLTRPESGNPERVASMGQRTHHSQVTLPTPSKKTDLAPQLVVSLTDVKSPQAQLAREDSSHFSQLNPFKTEPGNHHHGSSMDVAPLQSQKAPTIQSADRDKGLSTTQSMSFNKPNLVSQSVTSQTDEETASSVLALKRPILEQTQPQPPPLSLGYVQATGTSSLRPSCNIDIPTSQPLSSFKMDTVVKSPMSQKEPVLRLRALHAAEERDYRTQAMKTISDSDVSLVTTASTTDPISTKREHHQLSGNISSDRKNSGPRASFPYPSMPVMSDKTLEEGFKMTSPGSNGVSSDDVNSVDRTNSSLELTETGQIHLTDFEVYAKVFAISALKAIEDFLSVIFDTLTRMFTIITMPPAKDKDPGYDDTYDKDIRLSIPEKKASFLEGIPHGPWKRTFKGGEFPNNLTLSSTISPYAASAMYSDVNLRDLPVAPWCGTTLIGNPSGWYKQRGQARIDDVRHQEIQSMSPVDQWHRTRRIPRLCKVMNGSGPRGSGPYVTPPIREKAAMARLTNYPMRLQGEGGLWSPEIRPEYRKPHPGSTVGPSANDCLLL